MANCRELQNISKARLKSAEILMRAEDWDGAAYMLGYVLECALKACTVKALRLNEYPTGRGKHDSHFMTHNFDQLLVLSGLSDIFNNQGNAEAFRNWSEFTKYFPAEWPAMRYNLSQLQNFTSVTVPLLHQCIVDENGGILKVISSKKRW